MFNDVPNKLIKQVKEMLEIDRIKELKERFLATVEWTIGTLEKCTPLEFIYYNDLHENSSFYKYYKTKAFLAV
ncbi:MAG: hypothetical protein HC831_09765 [Chloroflexia bacterium]|nr:hypothetical protein [Chloroflexia bacterium]